ncbi:MAG: hypothetical protein K8R48_07130 [Alphaproteobacteria bacterium]|nr:hypothetical protein [Alphaproteobacteria bacterium]
MENKGCCSPANACGPEKSGSCETTSCCGKLIKGAIVGGIIMFAYMWASWSFVPMHKATTLTFKQEISAAATAPADAEKPAAAPKKAAVKAMKAEAEKAEPEAATAEDAAKKKMKTQLIYTLLFSIFNALLLTCLLKKSCYGGGCPVKFSMTVGLLAGAVSYLPNLVWFGAPLNYTLLGMADNLIAFTLAGAVISKCLFKGSCEAGAGVCETTAKGAAKGADKKSSCH